MSVVEEELLRARWRRALERQALDTVDREDFGLGPLARRLRTPTVQLLLLPSDPEAESVVLDEWLRTILESNTAVAVAGRGVVLGNRVIPTAHAAALVDYNGGKEPWNSFAAVHRSGVFELGLGGRGGWDYKDGDGGQVRVFQLISTVARVASLLRLASSLTDRVPASPPYQLTVGLRDTHGALLGNVGEGWAEATSWENDVGGCAEEHLVWHLRLESLPDDEDDQLQVAFQVGDRVEDAWGMPNRRYLARRGESAGLFDIAKLER